PQRHRGSRRRVRRRTAAQRLRNLGTWRAGRRSGVGPGVGWLRELGLRPYMEKEDTMSNRIETVGMGAAAALVGAVLLASPSHALACRATLRGSDGVILVSASNVGGLLHWGAAQGSETT